MTVELQIHFTNNAFAREFMEYLKENGCASTMGLAIDKNATVVWYQGRVAMMEALFSSVETAGSDVQFREKKLRAVQRGRAWLAKIKTYVDELYEKCELGVEYAEYEDIYEKAFGVDKKIMRCTDFSGNEEMGRQKLEMVMRMSSVCDALCVLKNNGCISWDWESKKITFISPCKPFGDFVVSTRGEGIFTNFFPGELESAGIQVNQDQTLETLSVVVPEPAFARMDLEKVLEDLHDDLDFDQDVEERIRLYSDLFRCVRDAVKTGEITVGELKEQMLGVLKVYGEFSEQLDECVQLILDTMSQAGCIVCEDGMVKPGK